MCLALLEAEAIMACACRPFIAAFCAFAIAQLLKIFTFWYTDRKWEMTRVVGSGGMPSSHTAMVGRCCPILLTLLSSPIILQGPQASLHHISPS